MSGPAKIEDLKRKYKKTGQLNEMLQLLTEQLRIHDSDMNESAFYEAIRKFPASDELRVLFAQYLNCDINSCRAYLEACARVKDNTDSEQAWQEFHAARLATPELFRAHMEQPSLLAQVPLALDAVWIHFGLGDIRPARGTYDTFSYQSQPDLPVHVFENCGWLGDFRSLEMHPNSAQWLESVDQTEQQVKALGFTLPDTLITLFRDVIPRRRLESVTDCYFAFEFKPVTAMDGLVLPFYNDSQSCVTWGVWLHKSGAHAVVSFNLLWDFDPEEADPPEDLSSPIDENGTRFANFRFCAPSIEAFLCRVWVENEIWFGLHPGFGEARDLEAPILANHIRQLKQSN